MHISAENDANLAMHAMGLGPLVFILAIGLLVLILWYFEWDSRRNSRSQKASDKCKPKK
jgi:hypothetical protein